MTKRVGWQESVLKIDNKVPLILIGLIVGAILFTSSEQAGFHWQHLFHHKTTHFVSNHLLMWIFFAYLGIEITIKSIRRAGKFIGLSAIGGMLIPPVFCWLLIRWFQPAISPIVAFYVAIGAAATDVAFSIGASKILTKGMERVLQLLVAGLLILAVGDDLGGIGILAGLYAQSVDQTWMFLAVGVMIFTFFCGEQGVINFIIQEDGRPSTRKKYQWVVEIKSTAFWALLAFANTFVLYLAGVEWVIGGCIALIMAPPDVKKKLHHATEPYIPLVLLVFGLVNGAINILDSSSWSWLTAACLIGGMGGKIIGINIGGFLGRAWSRRDPENVYGKTPSSQIVGLSILAAVNGTVAIFFVAMAESKGFISPTMAAQAKLGFFLTVPLTYGAVWILKTLKIVNDSPEFQPPQETEDPFPTTA